MPVVPTLPTLPSLCTNRCFYSFCSFCVPGSKGKLMVGQCYSKWLVQEVFVTGPLRVKVALARIEIDILVPQIPATREKN